MMHLGASETTAPKCTKVARSQVCLYCTYVESWGFFLLHASVCCRAVNVVVFSHYHPQNLP